MPTSLSLVLGLGSRACAFPLAHAIEAMRPLPIVTLAGVPPYVLGLAIIRGGPMPVVHLGRLVGAGEADVVSRFVTLRLGDRKMALAVRSVLGVRELDPGSIDRLPPIFGPESAAIIESIGRLDSELLLVLGSMRLLPESIWTAVSATGAAS